MAGRPLLLLAPLEAPWGKQAGRAGDALTPLPTPTPGRTTRSVERSSHQIIPQSLGQWLSLSASVVPVESGCFPVATGHVLSRVPLRGFCPKGAVLRESLFYSLTSCPAGAQGHRVLGPLRNQTLGFSLHTWTPTHPVASGRYLLGGPEPWLLVRHHRSLLQLHARWADVSQAHHGLQGTHLPAPCWLALWAPALPWAQLMQVLAAWPWGLTPCFRTSVSSFISWGRVVLHPNPFDVHEGDGSSFK